jgi:hypothetical protein
MIANNYMSPLRRKKTRREMLKENNMIDNSKEEHGHSQVSCSDSSLGVVLEGDSDSSSSESDEKQIDFLNNSSKF